MGQQSAADTQAQAQQTAANTQLGMFNTTVRQEQPYIGSGYGAISNLNALMGISPQTVPGAQGVNGTGGSTNQGNTEPGWRGAMQAAGMDILPQGAGSGGQAYIGDSGTAFTGAPQSGVPLNSLTQGYGNFGFDPSNLQNMPGYQFQLNQGDQAIQNRDSAGQGALSGATLKDLTTFNQGLAGTYENQYFNQALSNYNANQGNYYTNQQNIFNRLYQISQLGQNAAGNLGGTSAQLGTGIAQAQAAAGGSIAGGQLGAANAYAGAANQIPLYMLMQGNQGTTTSTGLTPGVPGPNG